MRASTSSPVPPKRPTSRRPPSTTLRLCLALTALLSLPLQAQALNLVRPNEVVPPPALLEGQLEWSMGEMDRVVGRWGPRLPRRLERRAIDESEEETTTTTTTRRARTSRTTAEEEEEETTSSGAGTKATRTRTTTTTASTTSVAAKQATRMAAVDTEEGAEDSTTEIVATTIDTGALASAATSIPLAIATTTVTKTGTASAALSTSTRIPYGYQLPEAFDSTLGTNFTGTACPSFFKTFLADPTFLECAPFSLLLTTSSAFFTAQRSPLSLLPYVLDQSCSSSNETCQALMSTLATQIRLSNTCGPDLNKRNPLVVEALEGFQNYQMMREVGCQKNEVTGQYCFAEALLQPDPSELYFYYLPEGTSIPSGTTTGCESCTQGLFSIYANYAINSTLAISRTYSAGRSVAVLNCGPTFAPLVANNNNNVSFALSKKRDQATSFGLAMMLSVLVGVWSVWA